MPPVCHSSRRLRAVTPPVFAAINLNPPPLCSLTSCLVIKKRIGLIGRGGGVTAAVTVALSSRGASATYLQLLYLQISLSLSPPGEAKKRRLIFFLFPLHLATGKSEQRRLSGASGGEHEALVTNASRVVVIKRSVGGGGGGRFLSHTGEGSEQQQHCSGSLCGLMRGY